MPSSKDKKKPGHPHKVAQKTPSQRECNDEGKKLSGADLVYNKKIRMMVVFIVILFLSTNMGEILGLENVVFHIFILFVSMLLLIVSSDRFLVDAKALARNAGIPEIVIGLTIVSIGTSVPEIASTGMASFRAMKTQNPGLSDFVLGNIYGSVLVQITLILGLVVLVKPMLITRGSIKRDGLMMIGSVSLLSVFVLYDGILSRLESLVLITIYILFLVFLYRNRKGIMMEEEAVDQDEEDDEEAEIPLSINAIMLGLGLGFVIYSSNWLVLSAVEVAECLRIPEGIIGLTVSAVGTSLPELAIALAAVSKSRGVAIGTLIGSNVTDPLLSVGIAGVIYPVVISPDIDFVFRHLIVPFTIFSCILGVMFMWSKWKLVRWEGAVLVGAYLIFVPVVIFYM